MAADTQKFVQAIFCPIAQGYGATETTAGVVCVRVRRVCASERASARLTEDPAAPTALF